MFFQRADAVENYDITIKSKTIPGLIQPRIQWRRQGGGKPQNYFLPPHFAPPQKMY
jgi:hypothetical protein